MRKIQDRLDGMAVGNDSMLKGSPGAVTGESFNTGGSFTRLADGSIGRCKEDEEFEMSWRRDSIWCQSIAGSAFRVNTTRPNAHSSTLLTQSRMRSHSKIISLETQRPLKISAQQKTIFSECVLRPTVKRL
jgi:hypothetical protein